MAEIITNPLPSRGILYSETALANMAHRYSRLKPVQPGDRCCNCGQDCDAEGFAQGYFHAVRVNGHPFCARSHCYGAHLAEFTGQRSGCRCGAKEKRKIETKSV